MPKHEKSRNIVIVGRRFKIGKFDALTGNYIAIKLLSKVAHLVAGFISKQIQDKAVIAMSAVNALGGLTKQEVIEIHGECLYVCRELKTVGEKEIEMLIKTEDGQWGVPDIEDDPILVATLVGHVLLFNFESFFDESALKEFSAMMEVFNA